MNKLYRFLLFIILISTALIIIPNSIFASFSDVLSSHVNKDAIDYVQSQGIVSGYSDSTFKPDNTINRAEFTKIVVEAQYDKATIDNCISKNTQSGWSYVFFPDVPISEWFAKYVCVAKDKGIIGGYPDGTFKPADKINFVEAAKIIVNAFGYTVSSDTVWYKPFVEKLSEKKSIPTTITDLTKSITRGEMAEMIYRLQKEISNKSTMEFKNSALVKAADTSTSTSACADFPDKLDSCTKYSCKFLHPFTGEEMTKQILGLENDKCHYTEEMPNDGKMECYYPSSLRKAVAQEYKDLQSAQDTSVSVKIGSEGTKVTYTVDGKTVSSPSQEALDSGACVVSGY